MNVDPSNDFGWPIFGSFYFVDFITFEPVAGVASSNLPDLFGRAPKGVPGAQIAIRTFRDLASAMTSQEAGSPARSQTFNPSCLVWNPWNRRQPRHNGRPQAAPPPKGELRAEIEALAGRQWRTPSPAILPASASPPSSAGIIAP
jgi:hypothetical protein